MSFEDEIDAICRLFEYDLRSVQTVRDFEQRANLFAQDPAIDRWYNRLFHRGG